MNIVTKHNVYVVLRRFVSISLSERQTKSTVLCCFPYRDVLVRASILAFSHMYTHAVFIYNTCICKG